MKHLICALAVIFSFNCGDVDPIYIDGIAIWQTEDNLPTKQCIRDMLDTVPRRTRKAVSSIGFEKNRVEDCCAGKIYFYSNGATIMLRFDYPRYNVPFFHEMHHVERWIDGLPPDPEHEAPEWKEVDARDGEPLPESCYPLPQEELQVTQEGVPAERPPLASPAY